MNESDFMRERRERADAEQYQLDRMRALQRMLLVRFADEPRAASLSA